MKVISIRKVADIFEVELKPNFIERLFGADNKIEKYKKDPYQTFTYGNGGVYYNEKGKELRNKHYIQIYWWEINSMMTAQSMN